MANGRGYVHSENRGAYFDMVRAARATHEAEMAKLRKKRDEDTAEAEAAIKAAHKTFLIGKAEVDRRERMAIADAQKIRNETEEFKRPRPVRQPQNKPFGLRAR